MPVNKQKTVRTSVIVPADIYRDVQALAEANDVSAAWIMRHALLEFLKSHKGETAIPIKHAGEPSRRH